MLAAGADRVSAWPRSCSPWPPCSTASATLRRALADPSPRRRGQARPGRAALRQQGRRRGARRAQGAVVGQRWAAERDLADTLESLAVEAVLADAERGGRLDARRGRAIPLRADRRCRPRPARRAVRPGIADAAARPPSSRAARGQGHAGDPGSLARPSPRPRAGASTAPRAQLPRARGDAARAADRHRHRRRSPWTSSSVTASRRACRRIYGRPVMLKSSSTRGHGRHQGPGRRRGRRRHRHSASSTRRAAHIRRLTSHAHGTTTA